MTLEQLLENLAGKTIDQKSLMVEEFMVSSPQSVSIADFEKIYKAADFDREAASQIVDIFIREKNINIENLPQLFEVLRHQTHDVAMVPQDIQLLALESFIEHVADPEITFRELNELAGALIIKEHGDLATVLKRSLNKYFEYYTISPEDAGHVLSMYDGYDGRLTKHTIARNILDEMKDDVDAAMVTTILTECARTREGETYSVLLSKYMLMGADKIKFSNDGYISLWQRVKESNSIALQSGHALRKDSRIKEQGVTNADVARSLQVFFRYAREDISVDWFLKNVLPYFNPEKGIGANDFKASAIASFICSPRARDLDAQKLQLLFQEKECTEPEAVKDVARALRHSLRNKIINAKESSALLNGICAVDDYKKAVLISMARLIKPLDHSVDEVLKAAIKESIRTTAEVIFSSIAKSELGKFLEILKKDEVISKESKDELTKQTLLCLAAAHSATRPASANDPSPVMQRAESAKLDVADTKAVSK